MDFIVTVTRDGEVLRRMDVPEEALDTRWDNDPVQQALRAALLLIRAGFR